eukprot:17661-Heterococcus_DN1.PRE.2
MLRSEVNRLKLRADTAESTVAAIGRSHTRKTSGSSTATDTSTDAPMALIHHLEHRVACLTSDMLDIAAAHAAATTAVKASEARVTDAMQAVRKANDERDAAIAKVVSSTYSSDATAKQIEQDNAHWREILQNQLDNWWESEFMPLHSGIKLQWNNEDSSGVYEEPVHLTAINKRSLNSILLLKQRFHNVALHAGHEAVAQALVTAKLEAIECEGRVCTAKRSETRAKDEIVRLQRQLSSLTNELHMVRATSSAVSKVARGPDATSTSMPSIYRNGISEEQNIATILNGSSSEVLALELEKLQHQLLAVQCYVATMSRSLSALVSGLTYRFMHMCTFVFTLQRLQNDILHKDSAMQRMSSELRAIHTLNERLRSDESKARTTLGDRVTAVKQEITRRAAVQVTELKQALAAERTRFTSEVGTLRADLLKLESELSDVTLRNQELETAIASSQPSQSSQHHHIAATTTAGEYSTTASDGNNNSNGSNNTDRVHIHNALKEDRDRLQRLAGNLATQLRASQHGRGEAEAECERLTAETAIVKADLLEMHTLSDVQQATLNKLQLLLEQIDSNANANGGASGGLGYVIGESTNSNTNGISQQAAPGPLANALVASKVACADLERRLKQAAASEADVRRMLQRRDRRIDELKADLRYRRSAPGARLASNTATATATTTADSEHDDDIQHAVHDNNGDNAATTNNTTSLRLRLVEQAAVIRHLELQLAAVTSETGAATASRHIASTVANAVGNRQSTSNTSSSKNKATKKYTAATGGADTGNSDDINATCPVCDTLRLQLHEAEGRRTVAESQRDQLTARIAALDTTQHSNNASNSDTNIRSGSGNSDRAASAFNGSDSEPLQATSTSVPGQNDVMSTQGTAADATTTATTAANDTSIAVQLNKLRIERDGLERETLRLREELLKQRKTYTAAYDTLDSAMLEVISCSVSKNCIEVAMRLCFTKCYFVRIMRTDMRATLADEKEDSVATLQHQLHTLRAEHESRINEMVQSHDRRLQQLQSTTAAARQEDATTIAQQLAALDTKYTATVTGLREALKQTRAKLKQLLSNSSGSTSGGTASHRGATTASSRARVTSGDAPAKSSTLTSTAASAGTAAVQSATQLSVEEVLALLAISDQQGLEANAEVRQLRYDMKATQSQLTAALSQLQKLDATTTATTVAATASNESC